MRRGNEIGAALDTRWTKRETATKEYMEKDLEKEMEATGFII